VALSVWLGIFVYLWRLDAQARELRRRLEQRPEATSKATPTATLRARQPDTTAQEPRTGTVKAENQAH
jgi:CcmD family protein